jgi:hypothetical protein
LSGTLLPTFQKVAVAVQQQVAEAQQLAATLEALLTRYRQHFGDLPE